MLCCMLCQLLLIEPVSQEGTRGIPFLVNLCVASHETNCRNRSSLVFSLCFISRKQTEREDAAQ